MADAACGTGHAFPSEALEATPGFSVGVHIASDLVFCVTSYFPPL